MAPEHWEVLERAAVVYHNVGSPVLACLQASNCVRDVSFVDRDGYAIDPAGRRIPCVGYPAR